MMISFGMPCSLVKFDQIGTKLELVTNTYSLSCD